MSTHFTGPVLNGAVTGSREWFDGLPIGQEPSYSRYFNDFLNTADYAASDWTITTVEAGAGDATEAIGANALNGTLVITNDSASGDSDSLQLNEETFALTSGKQLWFEARFKIDNPALVNFMIGLNVTDTTPLTTATSTGFKLASGSAALSCHTTASSTTTTTSSIATLVADTYVTCGFKWDGSSSVKFFVDRALVATHTTNIPTGTNQAITMHIANGSAVSRVLTVDYLYCVQER